MSIGAIDCVDVARLQADASQRQRLADTLYHAAEARVVVRSEGASATTTAPSRYDWNGKCVLIGSSTGGVDALERVFSAYPSNGPATLVAQHMPPAFLRSFAARLDAVVAPRVRLAEEGMALRQGEIYLAAGGMRHIALDSSIPKRLVTPPASGDELYVPSVDLLFSSAQSRASDCVAVILTGMGRDGAETLLALRNAGAETLVQSGETCVIDGMPRAARAIGAAGQVLPLDQIGAAILAATQANLAGRANA
jgi:two-component system chemotaxis response regulator CheB